MTAPNDQDKLYGLLPALYRERDAEHGEPLRALLRIIEAQAGLIEADIQRLWDNTFIETCDPWVVTYIGDLLDNAPLFDASRIRQPDTAGDLFSDLRGPRLVPEVALRNRADVAKTIYYRRRKGTASMLEELARDVTGWCAHVVEFFGLVGWSQCVRNHVRADALQCPDIRAVEAMDRLDGPFDHIAHTADVRALAGWEGWHHLDAIGFFLWRLGSYELEKVEARQFAGQGDCRRFFSPLGNSSPLFSRWRREGGETGLVTEFHVPGPIRPALFYEDLTAYQALETKPGQSEFYGPNRSLEIFYDEAPIPAERIRCKDLSAWTDLTAWTPPEGDLIDVDVALGRIALGADLDPNLPLEVSYHYGFSADMGGGPYRRAAWQVLPGRAQHVLLVEGNGAAGTFSTIAAALVEWAAGGKENTVISIQDNGTYEQPLSIEPEDGKWLVIEAADGKRPHLQLGTPLTITGQHAGAEVTLSGLLIEGGIEITGSLASLRLLHTTLVPGWSIAEPGSVASARDAVPPSILVEEPTTDTERSDQLGDGTDGLEEFRLEIAFSITGPLRLPREMKGVWLLDSILDGVNTSALAAPNETPVLPGPPAWLERVTVIGECHVKELTRASEVIFNDMVDAERRQAGCVRFSYVPEGSITPRRYRCQPDLEIAKALEKLDATADRPDQGARRVARESVSSGLVPRFVSKDYGRPAYLQLHPRTPKQIAQGAEDGSEMGAFCHLKQPQREANLRLRLQEYLPFGLEPGVIFVT